MLIITINAFGDVDEFGFGYSNTALGNRPNLNTKPKPSIPIVSAPAGLAVQRADGRQLPPYDTIYEFDQVRPLHQRDDLRVLTRHIAHRSQECVRNRSYRTIITQLQQILHWEHSSSDICSVMSGTRREALSPSRPLVRRLHPPYLASKKSDRHAHPGEANAAPYSGYLTNRCDLRPLPRMFSTQMF